MGISYNTIYDTVICPVDIQFHNVDPIIVNFAITQASPALEYITLFCLEKISATTLEKLLDLYYLDFVLFGYDITPFIKILNDKKIKEDINKDNTTISSESSFPTNVTILDMDM